MNLRKILLALALLFLFCIGAFYFYLKPRYVEPILMYHHIDEQGEISSLSVSVENLRRQMCFLSRRNYNVISLKEFVQAKKKKVRFPRNTVVLTFDDGYEDNYTFAYRILKKYNLPATIFVIVEKIGKEGYLDYAPIKEMLASGIIDIGSHTLSGAYLPGKTAMELEQEIGLSKKVLQTRFDGKVDLFCYPIGGFTSEIQEIVKRYGYQAACTTNRGKVQTYLNDDIFALKRIKVTDDSPNLFVFWVKISGYYNLFRRVRKPF